MKEKICLRVPVVVVKRLQLITPSYAERSVNQQLGDIFDNFYWGLLPYEYGFDPLAYSYKQVTLLVSKAARANLKTYCEWNGKMMGHTFAQALVDKGLFEVPLNRFSP